MLHNTCIMQPQARSRPSHLLGVCHGAAGFAPRSRSAHSANRRVTTTSSTSADTNGVTRSILWTTEHEPTLIGRVFDGDGAKL